MPQHRRYKFHAKGATKKPRKPRNAYGMECWVDDDFDRIRRVTITGAVAEGRPRDIRGMAAWLIRAADWVEAGNG